MVISCVADALAFSPKPLRAVLFDIDGTLVNSDPIHFRVFRELLLKEEGFNDNEPIDDDFFRKKIAGRANAPIMADLFPSWSIVSREAWSIQKEARFRVLAGATMLESKMGGLDRFRAWIDGKKLRKAAVTNAPRPNAEAMLSGIGFDVWFGEWVVIGDECDRPKPDPCPYLTACGLLGVNAENCIVVEDSPSGARAGVAAGAFVIGVLSGQDRSTLENVGCRLVINDFDDPRLWDHLKTLSIIPACS